jgi:hypothetical protein
MRRRRFMRVSLVNTRKAMNVTTVLRANIALRRSVTNAKRERTNRKSVKRSVFQRIAVIMSRLKWLYLNDNVVQDVTMTRQDRASVRRLQLDITVHEALASRKNARWENTKTRLVNRVVYQRLVDHTWPHLGRLSMFCVPPGRTHPRLVQKFVFVHQQENTVEVALVILVVADPVISKTNPVRRSAK